MADLVFEMCAEIGCDCDLPHLPEDDNERREYMWALAQIFEWRLFAVKGMVATRPN